MQHLGPDFAKSIIFFFFFFRPQISYQSIESSDPGINIPGPRRTVSKLRNETYHMFSNLHPGTTYLISVRARTTKGFGQTALTEITTNISGKSASASCRVWCPYIGVCPTDVSPISKVNGRPVLYVSTGEAVTWPALKLVQCWDYLFIQNNWGTFTNTLIISLGGQR